MIVTQPRRIVIKVGSNTLTDARGHLNHRYIASLADQIADLMYEGREVVLVTSAAIAAGMEVLGWSTRPEDIESLQAAASVGQAALMDAYAAEFGRREVPVGQVLLTRYDLDHTKSYEHARNTFMRLLQLGVLPIVNENDATAVDEIRFGDNDTLMALVARLCDADLAILLTDVDGLYDANPATHADARPLPLIQEIDENLLSFAPQGETGSDIGSGGMYTKLQAAQLLMDVGIPTIICKGTRGNVIYDCVKGETSGTLFQPRQQGD